MTYTEFLFALQLLGEERWGTRKRSQLRSENAVAAQNTSNLKRAANARSTR